MVGNVRDHLSCISRQADLPVLFSLIHMGPVGLEPTTLSLKDSYSDH